MDEDILKKRKEMAEERKRKKDIEASRRALLTIATLTMVTLTSNT